MSHAEKTNNTFKNYPKKFTLEQKHWSRCTKFEIKKKIVIPETTHKINESVVSVSTIYRRIQFSTFELNSMVFIST